MKKRGKEENDCVFPLDNGGKRKDKRTVESQTKREKEGKDWSEGEDTEILLSFFGKKKES